MNTERERKVISFSRPAFRDRPQCTATVEVNTRVLRCRLKLPHRGLHTAGTILTDGFEAQWPVEWPR